MKIPQTKPQDAQEEKQILCQNSANQLVSYTNHTTHTITYSFCLKETKLTQSF